MKDVLILPEEHHVNFDLYKKKRRRSSRYYVCVSCEAKVFPQVNLKGAAPAVITHCGALCFAPAVKSVFELTQTQSIVTVILST